VKGSSLRKRKGLFITCFSSASEEGDKELIMPLEGRIARQQKSLEK
jgi:hypothetical protein